MDYVVLKNDSDSGMIAISKTVFQSIAEITMKDIENITLSSSRRNVTVRIDHNQLKIDTDVRVKYGANVSETCGFVQAKIYENILFMTGYRPSDVKVNVVGFEI